MESSPGAGELTGRAAVCCLGPVQSTVLALPGESNPVDLALSFEGMESTRVWPLAKVQLDGWALQTCQCCFQMIYVSEVY